MLLCVHLDISWATHSPEKSLTAEDLLNSRMAGGRCASDVGFQGTEQDEELANLPSKGALIAVRTFESARRCVNRRSQFVAENSRSWQYGKLQIACDQPNVDRIPGKFPRNSAHCWPRSSVRRNPRWAARSADRLAPEDCSAARRQWLIQESVPRSGQSSMARPHDRRHRQKIRYCKTLPHWNIVT